MPDDYRNDFERQHEIRTTKRALEQCNEDIALLKHDGLTADDPIIITLEIESNRLWKELQQLKLENLP